MSKKTIELPNPFIDDETDDETEDVEFWESPVISDDDMEMFIVDGPPDMDVIIAEGWEAAESGKLRDQNPYGFGGGEHESWKVGWLAYYNDMGIEQPKERYNEFGRRGM
jgi:hypothetical protein